MLNVVRPNLIAVLDFCFLNHREFGIRNIVGPKTVCFNDYTKWGRCEGVCIIDFSFKFEDKFRFFSFVIVVTLQRK